MKSNRHLLTFALGTMAGVMSAMAQNHVAFDTPGAGNPFIPGYFADPTIRKFGDTYYLYATTDGSGAGFGPAQCWTSRDFQNWTLLPMNWPTSHWIWAPDVMQHTDGKYYMVYCQPCNLYIGQAETPVGPWHNLLQSDSHAKAVAVSGPQSMALGKEFDNEGQPIWVYDRYVTGAITLDGQTFVDDDGEVYVYWGTWGIYEGFGCGVGRASKDLKTFTETRLIPNTEAKDFFEAPFVLKRNGIYYFMDGETYEMYELTADQMGFNKYFIVDGMEVNLLFFENDLLNVQIPEKVELVIAETAPAIKGAPSNQTKDAVTNTGLKILVPQFIAEGEHVVVYTADGKYAGRA